MDFSGSGFLAVPKEPNPDDAAVWPASFGFPISSLERLRPIFIFPLFIVAVMSDDHSGQGQELQEVDDVVKRLEVC